VSASIRIKIMGGTNIADAYFDCAKVSERLGGIPIETDFNGVEMFYNNQPLTEWKDEYHTRIYGISHKKGGAK